MTVIFVTHDIDEAVWLGSQVAVLTRRPGRLKALLTVNLPRPRRAEMLVSGEFMSLKKQCMNLLYEETRDGADVQEEPAAPVSLSADEPLTVSVAA